MCLKVLIIEDNDQNRYLFSYMLKGKGYDVLEAKTGREGVEMAKTESPDLILLDIQLPDIDGYKVAETLRILPVVGTIPVIAVTSYAMVGDREKCIEAGCTGYIEKPINPQTFIPDIETILKKIKLE